MEDQHLTRTRLPGQDLLAFEDKQGQLDLVSAEEMGQVLQNGSVFLTVLDACQSAQDDADDAFSSIAWHLIQGGLDAVITMSGSMLIANVARYLNAFYGKLVAGIPLPLAHEQARQALYHGPHHNTQLREVDREPQPIKLFDWWVPHFYQKGTLTLNPVGSLRKRQHTITLSGLPDEPRYGFSGRSRELLQIERWLCQGKVVVIAGIDGIGKTALARETADWLTCTSLYTHACFVSFEHGGDASTLLSTLGNALGVYDSHYNPQNRQTALAKLASVLKMFPTLVLADNLESLLPEGKAPLSLEERNVLWETLLELSRLKAGVLLTCRDSSLGDGRLAEGDKVAYLLLDGLYPEDAYLFASRLLTDLQVDRASQPYTELCDLLKQLDYHPLAIQLVLCSLCTHSLETIRQQFAELLPQLTNAGSSRSLLASLQYSLNRLSNEHRALLPRLALFEGGAHEENLLAITRISESDWADLRLALEQMALLIPEVVYEGISRPFLHFHSVLLQFLRDQPGVDTPALRQRYATCYSELASHMYARDRTNPLAARALVRRELPNLSRALAILLEEGQSGEATHLAGYIVCFLNFFGWARERDDVRQSVAQAISRLEGLSGEDLTQDEYYHRSGLGNVEFESGNYHAAYTHLMALLERIEAQPEDRPLGSGTIEHSITLYSLARCLLEEGQQAAGEVRLQQALVIIEELVKQEPENQNFILHQSYILTHLGEALHKQGRYPQARLVYERSLDLATQQGDERSQAVILSHLGTMALEQRLFSLARERLEKSCFYFHALGEPAAEAEVWLYLGTVDYKQQKWLEAERCYYTSLSNP